MSVQLNLSTNGAELKAAYREVVDKDCSTNWILLGYTKGSNELKVDGKGDGGLEELSEEFMDDKVQFALARVTDPNSQLPKFVFISWCGEGAPVQRKGLLPSHLGHVQKFFEGYHVQINARDADDVTPEQIMKKIFESSGAKYSYHDQVRKQAPTAPAVVIPSKLQASPSVTSYKSSMEANPPVSNTNSVRSPSFKPPPASKSLQNRFQQQVDQTDKEKQIREEQERFEREFLQRSHSKSSQGAWKVGNVSSRVQEARDREERELQERLEKARISRGNSISGNQSQDRGIERQKEREALENAKRQEEERRREAEAQEQRQAEARLREQNQRQDDEAARLQEREDQLRIEREREARLRQEAQELEKQEQEREKERLQREQEELESRQREQMELEARQRKQEELEARQREQRESEARKREQEEQDRKHLEALKEQESTNSQAKEASAEEAPPSTAIALFDYTAVDETDISLKEGELIVSIQQVDEGWWKGTNEAGESGIFPANYVELVAPPEPAAPQQPPFAETCANEEPSSQAFAIALYDYEASEEGEISFAAADRVTNIDFLSDDWWQGTNLAGQSGLFP
ncbi:actin binding protein, partial [Massospora cicadina]